MRAAAFANSYPAHLCWGASPSTAKPGSFVSLKPGESLRGQYYCKTEDRAVNKRFARHPLWAPANQVATLRLQQALHGSF